MSKVVFITPEDARYGFAMAGAGQVVAGNRQIDRTLEETAADPAVRLIFLDERLHGGLSEEWLADFDRHWPGMLVVLPPPEKLAAPEEDYARQLIVKAIGYQVRL